MVRNHDDTSFVSWAATLHPESAVSTIDPRLQESSPWATVYYETCGGGSSSSSSNSDLENVPIAVQVIPLDEEDGEIHTQEERRRANFDPESQLPSPETTNQNGVNAVVSRPQPWKHSNLIDLIIGASLAICSFFSTIKIEIAAIIVYTIAAGFNFLAEEIFGSTPMLLAKSICMTLTAVLLIVDAVLLTCSVLVTEILGGVAFFLCALFGGPRSGTEWHQFIRKTCHLTRWGFRNCHKDWKPARIFPISMEVEREHYNQHLQLQQQQHEEDHEDTPGSENGGCCEVSDARYRDSPSPRSPSVAGFASDDISTLTDTATYPPDEPSFSAVAMVDPENVFVLNPEEQAEDRHFIKNTQQVVMS